MSNAKITDIRSVLDSLSFWDRDNSEGYASNQALTEIAQMVISGRYGEAHSALCSDSSLFSRNQRKELQTAISDAFLFSRELEWSSHGIWRSFRFWSESEKQQYLINCLEVISCLKKITPFVVFGFGSVLGFVRERGFIGHDDDMDLLVAFPLEQVDNFSAAKKLVRDHLVASGFETYNEGPTHMTVKGADVFVGFIEHDGRVSWFPSARAGLNLEDVFPTSTQQIHGIFCELPANPEKYLEITYGSDWKKPDASFIHPWDQSQYRDFRIEDFYLISKN